MRNLRRIFATLTVAALGTLGIATPASAATVFGCYENAVCMFDGTNYGTYSWLMVGLNDIRSRPGNCLDLFDEHIQFNNAVSSIIVNPGQTYASNTWKVRFWMNANCTGTPVPYAYVGGPTLSLDADISNGAGDFNVSANFSNAISGVSFGA